MDLKQRHGPTKNNTSKQNPDGKTASSSSYLTKYLKSLNLNQKMSVSQKHNTTKQESLSKDTLLQAKSMTASTIVESTSSKPTSLINKSCPQHRKESKVTKQVVCSSKEKPKKKCSKEVKKSTRMDMKDFRSSYDCNIDFKKLSLMVKDEVDDADNKGRRLSVGRRRSFCETNVELAGIFASNGVKVVAVDMPPFMQIHAVDCARKTLDSLEKFTSKSLALTLKKEFDGVYGPAWHCIVGKSFGSFVTHSVGGFMYFSMDQKLYILLFKTTVLKAE